MAPSIQAITLLSPMTALIVVASAMRMTRGAEPVPVPYSIQRLTTEDGVPFDVLDNQPRKPAPTLIVLGSTPEKSLGDTDILQCGAILSRQGFLCASLDVPCHGADHRANEPSELAGWSHRLDAGEDLIGDFIERAKSLLDHLIATGAADPDRIAVCGVSRGGFMAFHLAAHDKRVRNVIAFAPVTKLAVLNEFHEMKHPERAEALSAASLADRLADRQIWIVIGDRDLRVSTDETIALARRLSATAVERNLPPPVDLLVLGEPGGHRTPQGSAEQSAAWLIERFAEKTAK